MEALMDVINRYEDLLDRLDDRAIARLNASIESAYKSLIAKLQDAYPRLSKDMSLIPAERDLLITAQLKDLLNVIKPDARDELAELIKTADGLGGESVEDLIRTIDPDFKVATFSRVSVEAAAIAADQSYQALLRRGETFAKGASETIAQGVLQGWGSARVAKAIKRQTEATQRAASMIARTETVRAAAGASKQRYVNSGVNYGIWITVITEVCSWCVGKGGQIYKIEDMVIPQHPNCRCTIIPVTPGWAKNDLIDFNAIADYSERVKKASGVKVRFDKAPFENLPPESISIESLKRKRSKL
ncbi:MAG: hypothetical protein F6K55_03070 [Moorea sp. SIO4A3]|nr:hypothetical protein [Moorena sp. SIO4A3]